MLYVDLENAFNEKQMATTYRYYFTRRRVLIYKAIWFNNFVLGRLDNVSWYYYDMYFGTIPGIYLMIFGDFQLLFQGEWTFIYWTDINVYPNKTPQNSLKYM